jgi:alpha-tubulin suppressor-like RCC1 family protein
MRVVPTILNGIVNVQSMATAFSTSFWILPNGTVFVSGSGPQGQLGMGSMTNFMIPTLNPYLSNITSIQPGQQHTLFLSKDGTLYTARSSQYGQTGLPPPLLTTIPTLLQTNVKFISTLDSSSFFITNDNLTYAFGWNQFAQLGFGDYVDRATPQTLPFSYQYNVAAVYSGAYWTHMILTNGNILSIACRWGYPTNTPQPVYGLGGTLSTLITGWQHVVVTTQSNEMYGFGQDASALGLGNTYLRPIPSKVPLNTSDYLQFSAGFEFTLFLSKNYQLYGTGASSVYGCLGNNSTQSVLTIGQINTPEKIVEISYTVLHTVLLAQSGNVYGFGYNLDGEVCNGNKLPQIAPYKIGMPLPCANTWCYKCY